MLKLEFDASPNIGKRFGSQKPVQAAWPSDWGIQKRDSNYEIMTCSKDLKVLIH